MLRNMEILLVRHGESTANAEGRLQGRKDFPLSELGRRQARAVASWLGRQGGSPALILSSPLMRARQTAEIIAAEISTPLEFDPLLVEVGMGALEGLTREELAERHPAYLQRPLEERGHFAAFGGESYEELQGRVRHARESIESRFRESDDRIVLVGHGGFNYQLLKQLICEPTPRICIVKMGNCSSTLVSIRERSGRYIGELVWHLPVELVGGTASAKSGVL
jgi:broad specificity phosphatase PhoE